MEDIEPTSTLKGDETILQHPAFAMVAVNRVMGGVNTMFGSPVKVGSYIELSVRRAESHDRGLRSYPSAKETVCTVRMTETQWAALISAMNVGEGIPATMAFGPVAGSQNMRYPGIIKQSDEERRKASIEKSLRDELQKTKAMLARIESLCESKGAISKTEMKSAVRDLSIQLGNAPKNFAYTAEQITEHMEKVTSAAKQEINAQAMAFGLSKTDTFQSLTGDGVHPTVYLTDD